MAQAKKQTTKKSTPKKVSSNINLKISNFKRDFKGRWNKKPSLYTGGTIILLIIVFLAVLFVSNKSIFLAGQINGKFVTTPEFYANLVSSNGQEAWDQLLRETLIKQKAAEKSITASEKEVNAELKKIETRFGGKEVFENTLAQNNTNIKEIKKQLEIQVLVEKLLADKIKVTDKEIAAYKKENSQTTADQTEIQIKDALKSQKLNEEFASWFEKVRKDANIRTYF